MRLLCAISLLILAIAITGCEQEATPLPIEIPPTATTAPPESSLPPLRYGIGVEASALQPTLGTNAEVEILSEAIDPARVGNELDLILTFGQLEGWTEANPLTVGLLLLPVEPFELNNIIVDSIVPQEIIESLSFTGAVSIHSPSRTRNALRSELANMGRPDGFSVSIGYFDVPGVETVSSQLDRINIDNRAEPMTLDRIQLALQERTIQLGIVAWSDDTEQTVWFETFPDAMLVPLYTLPISYLVAPEYTIEPGPLGFPIINR